MTSVREIRRLLLLFSSSCIEPSLSSSILRDFLLLAKHTAKVTPAPNTGTIALMATTTIITSKDFSSGISVPSVLWFPGGMLEVNSSVIRLLCVMPEVVVSAISTIDEQYFDSFSFSEILI